MFSHSATVAAVEEVNAHPELGSQREFAIEHRRNHFRHILARRADNTEQATDRTWTGGSGGHQENKVVRPQLG